MRWGTFGLGVVLLCLSCKGSSPERVPSAHRAVEAAPEAASDELDAEALVVFLPDALAGEPALARKAIGENLASATYEVNDAIVSINLKVVEDLGTERAALAYVDSVDLVETKGRTRRRVRVQGLSAGLRTSPATPNAVLDMLLGERISLKVSVERCDDPMIAVKYAERLEIIQLLSLSAGS